MTTQRLPIELAKELVLAALDPSIPSLLEKDAAKQFAFIVSSKSGFGEPTGQWTKDGRSVAKIVGFGKVNADESLLTILGDKEKASMVCAFHPNRPGLR